MVRTLTPSKTARSVLVCCLASAVLLAGGLQAQDAPGKASKSLSPLQTAVQDGERVRGVDRFPAKSGWTSPKKLAQQAARGPIRELARFEAAPSKSAEPAKSLQVGRARTRGDGAVSIATFCDTCGPSPVECGVPIEGEIDGTECVLELAPEGYSDVYELVLDAPQSVTINLTSDAFNPFLVFDDDCTFPFVVAFNDDCPTGAGTESCVTAEVGAGTYQIIVTTAAAEETGAYTLEVTCDEITTCVDCEAGVLVEGEAGNGALADGDCTRGGGEYLDIWSIVVEEAGSFAVTMESEAVDTALFAYDQDCIILFGNNDCDIGDTTKSCLTIDLDVGTHAFGASSFNAAEVGEYTLLVERSSAFDCQECRVGTAECNAITEGELAGDDCLQPDGTGLIDLYELVIEEAGPVVITLTSEEFDTLLTVYDNECFELGTNDDIAWPENPNSQLSLDLEPGTYVIGATSFAPASAGAYSLEITCHDVRLCTECVVGDAAINSSVTGDLSADDCVLDDGSYWDGYTLTLPAPLTVSIELTSSAFDTYLVLADDFCETLGENDDCTPGDVDTSCLEVSLPAGTYTIGVNSFDGGETGDYTLSIEARGVCICTECDAGTIGCEAFESGELTAEDCTLPSGQIIDAWSFSLDETQLVTINLDSGAFDTFLFLMDEGCDEIAANDDRPGELNSTITIELEAGDYAILVSQYIGAAGAVGAYDLSTLCEDSGGGGEDPLCVDCEVGTANCGEPTIADFPLSVDCTRGAGGQPLDLYSFEVTEDSLVQIDLTADYDTYLQLYNEACELIGFNDDGGEGLNSRLIAELDAGIYFAGSSSYSAAAVGTMTLDIQCTESVSVCREECQIGPVSCDEPVIGAAFPQGTCTRLTGQPLDLYVLELADAMVVTIDLTADYDTYVQLYDAECNLIAFDDDGGEGLNSRLAQQELAAGTYYVGASSYSAAAAGTLNLELVCAPAGGPSDCDRCTVGEVTSGETLTDTFPHPDTECLRDVNVAEIQYYSLVLPGAGSAYIRLLTETFDGFLIVLDADCAEVARNSDCVFGNTTLACLDLELEAGTYYVGVSSLFAEEVGEFDLDVLYVPDPCDGGGPVEEGVGPFVRGDCNGDGQVIGQVGDAVFTLNYNFTGGPAPSCLAACDSNGDGQVTGQVGDAIYTLNFNFLGGPAPTAPFPDCGRSTAEGDEALGCETPLADCP